MAKKTEAAACIPLTAVEQAKYDAIRDAIRRAGDAMDTATRRMTNFMVRVNDRARRETTHL